MSTNLLSSSTTFDLGGVVREFRWNWQNQELPVVYETLGNGSPLLLLPAFSTVSTREEMNGIAKLLACQFQVVTVDWPGFGESSRLPISYEPNVYQNFLENFVTSVFDSPIALIAAGHSAAYALQLAHKNPSAVSRIVLVAPTWRGPLPTMGANRQIAGLVREIVRSPILGQVLYKLNTMPSFLSFMYRRHVYVDAAKLTPDFIEHKWHNTQKPGGRFAPAAFVTGTLDAVHSQADFLTLAQGLSVPLMVVIGESSPPKSRADMEALAALSGVESKILPGSLGMHEEYPEVVAQTILPFLTKPLQTSQM